jgi:hypothetical protein
MLFTSFFTIALQRPISSFMRTAMGRKLESRDGGRDKGGRDGMGEGVGEEELGGGTGEEGVNVNGDERTKLSLFPVLHSVYCFLNMLPYPKAVFFCTEVQ